MQRAGASQSPERPVRPVRQALRREPLSAHQAPGRLLLLHLRSAGRACRSRALLRRDGPAHDQGDTRRVLHDKGRSQHAYRHTQRLGALRCAGTEEVAVRRVVVRCHTG